MSMLPGVLTKAELRQEVKTKIRHAQAEVKALMDAGIILPPKTA